MDAPHCRYTGPCYLAMIVPVIARAGGITFAGFFDWLVLAVIALAGGRLMWWLSERAAGTCS